MQTLNTSLSSHLMQEVTTLATCLRLVRQDGQSLGFTALDHDLTIDSLTYKSAGSLTHTAYESSADLRVNNLDVRGVLSDASITDADLLAGLYDNAVVDLFMVNYTALPSAVAPGNVLWLLHGEIGEVRLADGQFIAELRGLTDKLQQATQDLFTPSCRVKRLGDAQCGVSLDAYTHSYTISTLVDAVRFTHSSTPQADDYFQYGWLTWTSGANTGREAPIKRYENGVIELLEPPLSPLNIGDGFDAVRGCNRQFATCRDVFNNVANFRGEPAHLLPGSDKILNPL